MVGIRQDALHLGPHASLDDHLHIVQTSLLPPFCDIHITFLFPSLSYLPYLVQLQSIYYERQNQYQYKCIERGKTKHKHKHKQNRTKGKRCNNGIKHLPSQLFDQTSWGHNDVATTAAQKTTTDCLKFSLDIRKKKEWFLQKYTASHRIKYNKRRG